MDWNSIGDDEQKWNGQAMSRSGKAGIGADMEMTIYTIYENPLDYPGKYVVRRSIIREGGLHVAIEPDAVVDSLPEARSFIPSSLFCMPRAPHDDPCIVESWL